MATKALYRAFMHTARELERRKQPLLVQVPVLASRVQWYKPGAPQSQYVPTAPSLSETLGERMPRRARTTPDEQTGSQAGIVLLLTCASLAVHRLPVAAGGRAAARGCSEPRPAFGGAAPTHPPGLPQRGRTLTLTHPNPNPTPNPNPSPNSRPAGLPPRGRLALRRAGRHRLAAAGRCQG